MPKMGQSLNIISTYLLPPPHVNIYCEGKAGMNIWSFEAVILVLDSRGHKLDRLETENQCKRD